MSQQPSSSPAPTPAQPVADTAPSRHLLRWLSGVAATLTAAAAMAWSHWRQGPQQEWAPVALWAASVVAMALACSRPGWLAGWRRRLDRRDVAAVATVVAVGAAVLLPWLEIYPMEIGGDSTRDGGILVQRIVSGDIKDLFAYASYNGFSFIAPLMIVPSYLLLGDTSLSYKSVAAAVGMLTALTLYFLARRHLSVVHAVVAAVVLLTLPVFLNFARLETLVAFNPLWMVLTLAAVLAVFEREATPAALGLLGLVAGLTSLFHAAAKAAALLALALAAVFALWRTCARRQPVSRLFAGAGAAILGAAIGMGPLLLHTTPTIFLSLSRVQTGPRVGGSQLLDAYLNSVRVFFDRPVTIHVSFHEPLVPSAVLAALLALGAVLGWLSLPRHVYGCLLYFALVVPLTNSALTDVINGAHRCAPLLPVAALLIAAGIAVLRRGAGLLRPAALGALLGAVVLASAAWAAGSQAWRFFSEELARDHDRLETYLLGVALRQIEATPSLRAAPTICIGAGPRTFAELRLRHHREAFEYFLPAQEVRFELTDASRNELHLSASCLPPEAETWELHRYCVPRERFVCPGTEFRFAELLVRVDPRPPPAPEAEPAVVTGAEPPPGPRRLEGAEPVRRGVGSLLARWSATPLDLAALRAAGGVALDTNDPLFSRHADAIFDGDPDSFSRTETANPLVLTLELKSPVRLRSARLLLAGSRYDWVLEPEPGGTRALASAVPEREWSRLDLPAAVTTSEVRIEILRLERDDHVHLVELELWVDE